MSLTYSARGRSRRPAKATRRPAESPLRSLFNAIDEGYCLCELVFGQDGAPVDYRFIEVNPLFEDMTGLKNPTGRTAYELIPDLERHWLDLYAFVAMEGGSRRFERESEALGRWFTVFVTAVAPQGRFALVFRDITAQKQAERALMASEAHARSIIDSVSDGFISVDWDWRILYMNPRGGEIIHPLGLQRDQLRGLTLWEAFPDLLDTPFEALYRRAMVERVALSIEEYFPPLQSWFDVRCYPTHDGLAIHFLDISARRRGEEALRHSEARLRQLADAMPQLVWTADSSGLVDYYNSRIADYSGAVLNADGRWTWLGLVHADDQQATREAWSNAQKYGVVYQATHRVQMASGEFRWHLSRGIPVRDEHGRITRWFGTATDVHDLRQAEEALRESEARFRTITEAMPQMVWSARADGQTDFFNARWYEFTGVPEEASQGDAWRDLFHPDDQEEIEQRWSHSVRTGEAYEIEYRLRHHSGYYRWVLGRASPMREGGVVVRWFGSCTDIHEMKQAQEHRKLLMEELNHRVKNTLAVVQSLAFQSLRGHKSREEQLLSFEGRLRALAAAHDVLLRESWLRASLREIIESAQRACGLDLGRMRLHGPDVMLPPKQSVTMAMALHELCTNAVKYGALSSPAGRVEITLRKLGGNQFDFSWVERGGPPAEIPQQSGFRTRMLQRVLSNDFAASVSLSYDQEGFNCHFNGWLDGLRPSQAGR